MTRYRVKGLPRYGRCAVFGILNITPDSFSDGGINLSAETAVAHGIAEHAIEGPRSVCGGAGVQARGAALPPVTEWMVDGVGGPRPFFADLFDRGTLAVPQHDPLRSVGVVG